MNAEDDALLALLRALAARDYRFVTPTPATHGRVLQSRRGRLARDLRDVLGWSMPFERGLDPEIERLLEAASVLKAGKGHLRSEIRVSTLGGLPYLHSAFPTLAPDSVFFGPDSYRFAHLIEAELADDTQETGDAALRIIDVGTGAGVGGVVASSFHPGAHLTLTDVNPKALRFARINSVHAGLAAKFIECDGLDGVADNADLILINPPYMIDAKGRSYRNGGGMRGGDLSVKLAFRALSRLRAKGRLILYSGSAISDGRDRLHEVLADLAFDNGCSIAYREIDPDVFGEEVGGPGYEDVERIAVIAAVFAKS